MTHQLSLFPLPMTTPIGGNVPSAAPQMALIRGQQHQIQCLYPYGSPLARMSAYAVRAALKPLWADADIGHAPFAVKSTRSGMTITATTPDESAWLFGHLRAVIGVVFNLAGGLVTVHHECPEPRFEMGAYHLYRIGILTMTKKKNDWSAWENGSLTDEQLAHVQDLIRAGLTKRMAHWGIVVPDQLAIKVTDGGQPMGFSPADGPRAMCRKEIRFLMPAKTHHVFFLDHTLSAVGLNQVTLAAAV